MDGEKMVRPVPVCNDGCCQAESEEYFCMTGTEAPPHVASCYWGWSIPRTQTLDAQTYTQREKIRQDAFVPGTEKRDLLMIYTRLQEYYNWFS